jgi:peptidoglycan/LPS O-acetylase OafA/YrhL
LVRGYNNGLQIGRGIACLCVVVSHGVYMACTLKGVETPNWLTGQLAGFGVSLFFVLSGFLMGSILRRDKRPAHWEFLYHRALRIYPPYWAAAALFTLMYFWLGLPLHPFDPTALALSPVIWGASTYGVPAWTLTYEMLFYLLVWCWIAASASVRQVSVTALAWVALIIIVDIIFKQPYGHTTPGLFLFVSPMNLFFIAGLLIGIHGVTLERFPVSLLLLIGLFIFLASWVLEPVFRRLPPTIPQVAGCTLALVAFARWRPKGLGFGVVIGNASYGIYLVHMFVMDGIFRYAAPSLVGMPTFAVFAIMVSVSFSFGLAFGLIEFSAYRAMTAPQSRAIPLPA